MVVDCGGVVAMCCSIQCMVCSHCNAWMIWLVWAGTLADICNHMVTLYNVLCCDLSCCVVVCMLAVLYSVVCMDFSFCVVACIAVYCCFGRTGWEGC